MRWQAVVRTAVVGSAIVVCVAGCVGVGRLVVQALTVSSSVSVSVPARGARRMIQVSVADIAIEVLRHATNHNPLRHRALKLSALFGFLHAACTSPMTHSLLRGTVARDFADPMAIAATALLLAADWVFVATLLLFGFAAYVLQLLVTPAEVLRACTSLTAWCVRRSQAGRLPAGPRCPRRADQAVPVHVTAARQRRCAAAIQATSPVPPPHRQCVLVPRHAPPPAQRRCSVPQAPAVVSALLASRLVACALTHTTRFRCTHTASHPCCWSWLGVC